MYYYKVAVNTPFNNSILTYSSSSELTIGHLYWVPLGRRREKACIVDVVEKPDDSKYEIKQIGEAFDDNLKIDKQHLAFLSWCSRYYHYPLGQHVFDVLPKIMKRPKPFEDGKGQGEPLGYELTKDQETAIQEVGNNLKKFRKYLLQGVTGSGKTSVYIELIKKNTSNGKNTLLLIPEINLTPGLLKTLRKHLSINIHSYHSALTNSQRYGLWLTLSDQKEPYIIVAVRSGIFLPFCNIGLVIVDEEHDSSYKQEDRCPYHARDLATKLGSMNNCPVVLGSATPSFESYAWALDHPENHLHLVQRPGGKKMPEIDIVDRRESKNNDENCWPFTNDSLKEIKKKVDANEQVIVFVNRLGYASYVQCRSCGYQFLCKNCTLSLKYFRKSNELKCSTCDYKEPLPECCPTCENMKLLQKGFGTERLEEVLIKKFPDIKVGRFDREVIKNFKQMNEVLDSFNRGQFDVLIGTQMLSKGHNFENVNYVLVLGVDAQLNFPDFRSSENAYQLITQISGRSGRFGQDGHVAIESYTPENKIFKRIKEYDDKTFYKEELSLRKNLDLPPYTRLCVIYFTSKSQTVVSDYCVHVGLIAQKIKESHFESVDIIGVRPAIIEKRENKFSWTMLFRASEINDLHNFTSSLISNLPKNSRVSHKVDIDPQHLY
jgi:primosomal protein N' (replication factor Y)